jgi:hypothetical protein
MTLSPPTTRTVQPDSSAPPASRNTPDNVTVGGGGGVGDSVTVTLLSLTSETPLIDPGRTAAPDGGVIVNEVVVAEVCSSRNVATPDAPVVALPGAWYALEGGEPA